jgi:tetratricopeptide (TPR) repeat protein
MTADHDLFKKFGIEAPPPFSMDLPVHIADSQNEMRLIFVHHLDKQGFKKVESTKDGRDTLATLKTKPCEILIIAADIESVPGLDLTRELRESPEQHRPANILITPPPGKSEIMFALESGIDDFLVKPVVQGDIVAKMRSAYKVFNNPKNPERVYEFAKRLFKSGDLQASFDAYQELGKLNQKAARPHVGMARVHLESKETEKAMVELNTGIKKNENYVHAYELRGKVLLAEDNQTAALADFRKAIDLSPLNVARYESCCDILLKQNDTAGCISILETAVRNELQHPYIVERLGHCYFLQKDFAQALKYLKEAVRLAPSDFKYLTALAVCYRDAHDFEKSIETYNRMIKLDPRNHQVLFNKAITLKHMNKLEEAEKLLVRALEIEPNYNKAEEQLEAIRRARTQAS